MMLELIIGQFQRGCAAAWRTCSHSMIKGEATGDSRPGSASEEPSSLEDISHMPARVKCAVLGWHTMEDLLGEKDIKE